MPNIPTSSFAFKYVENPWSLPTLASNVAYLVGDHWDDFGYETLYNLFIYEVNGTKHEIGHAKIAQLRENAINKKTELPTSFPNLDENYFSLGQSDRYYDKLNALGAEIRKKILMGLNDIALNKELWAKFKDQHVTQTSLLRGISIETVEVQFHRIAQGGIRLTDYHFTYALGGRQGHSEISLTFDVMPNVAPPTNIHVLIGQNGTGKTHILKCMTKALVLADEDSEKSGAFQQENSEGISRPFANLVSVAFSAFDPFLALPEGRSPSTGIRYSYIGLKTAVAGENYGAPKDLDALTEEFVTSLDNCFKTLRIERWRRAVKVLEVDLNFKDKGFSKLATDNEAAMPSTTVRELFSSLSSGHKIVLLTITRLIEEVEEQTLVLLDEPEAHLHPPLLSAFVRSLSDLLIDRNGVAIIATHSPVVLQEVRKNCVWKLRRSGQEVQIDRPNLETFGENVGVLTREVFKLEVTNSGFHKMLSDVGKSKATFDEAVNYFSNALGAEARAMLRAIYADRDKNTSED